MSLRLAWTAATAAPRGRHAPAPGGFAGEVSRRGRKGTSAPGTRSWSSASCSTCRARRATSCLTVVGDLRSVRGLGQGMTRGHLVVKGDAGPQLGAEMTGGRIDVLGDVGDWAGAEMRGRDHTCVRRRRLLPGRGVSWKPAGDARRNHPGGRERRGGRWPSDAPGADRGPGRCRRRAWAEPDRRDDPRASGAVGRRVGAGMKRGTLILPRLPGDPDALLLPTFAPAGRFRMPFLRLYTNQLNEWGFAVPRLVSSGAPRSLQWRSGGGRPGGDSRRSLRRSLTDRDCWGLQR